MLAVDAGLRVVEIYPSFTSQICSRCDAWGARFSLVRQEDNNSRAPSVDLTGKLFICIECKYQANADFNASMNLHRKFYGEFPDIQPLDKGKTRYKVISKRTREIREYKVHESGEKAQVFLSERYDLLSGSFRKA